MSEALDPVVVALAVALASRRPIESLVDRATAPTGRPRSVSPDGGGGRSATVRRTRPKNRKG